MVILRVSPNRLVFYVKVKRWGIELTSDSEFKCSFVSILTPWVKDGEFCPHVSIGMSRSDWMKRMWTCTN